MCICACVVALAGKKEKFLNKFNCGATLMNFGIILWQHAQFCVVNAMVIHFSMCFSCVTVISWVNLPA